MRSAEFGMRSVPFGTFRIFPAPRISRSSCPVGPITGFRLGNNPLVSTQRHIGYAPPIIFGSHHAHRVLHSLGGLLGILQGFEDPRREGAWVVGWDFDAGFA